MLRSLATSYISFNHPSNNGFAHGSVMVVRIKLSSRASNVYERIGSGVAAFPGDAIYP